MSSLRHCGFFHLDTSLRGDPVDLLEDALARSGQGALLAETLLVLPEAFNITDNYFEAYKLDLKIEERLRELSNRLHLCFVVGLINDETGYNEAILIDGAKRKVLSRKRLWDGSPCYKPFTEQAKDVFTDHRNVNISALICRDATAEGETREKQQIRHRAIAKEFEDFAQEGKMALLCVPARFGSSVPSEVAKSWGNASIVIANWGSFRYPSILRLQNGQTCIARTDGGCHVHLATMPSQAVGPPPQLDP